MGEERENMTDGRAKILVDSRRRMRVSLVLSVITIGILVKLTHMFMFQFISKYLGVFWALTFFWGGWIVIILIFAFLFFVFWGIIITHMKGGE